MGQMRYYGLRQRRVLAHVCLLTLAAIILIGLAPLPLRHGASARRGLHDSAQHAPFYGHTFAIGDSVMLDAEGDLQQRGITVDAVVSRQFFQGIDILQWMHSAKRLPGAVVVALGTNGPFTNYQFDQMMQTLHGVQVVVFVSVKEPRFWEGEVNSALRAGVARWPHTQLADWYSLAVRHPEWFWGDGIHLRPEGSAPYAQLVAGALSRGWSDGQTPAQEARARR